MKRKTFIKQLGAYGISRNSANEMARVTRSRGWPYTHALERFKQIYEESCRQWMAATSTPRHEVPFWLVPYAGLVTIADAKPTMGYDLSNGKDMTCITPGYAKDSEVTALQAVYYPKGVAGNE